MPTNNLPSLKLLSRFIKLMPRIRSGGLFIADNMLRDGRVTQNVESSTEGLNDQDKWVHATTVDVKELTRLFFNSSDVFTTIIPLRDGISVLEKKIIKEANQMATMKCPRCGSENIMPNLTVVDRVETTHDDYLAIEIDRKPDALVFKGTHRELLRAAVCGECGNVDFTVDNPKGLWETYSQRENS